MDNSHSIADLLNGGAEPTPEEVSDLTSLGRFVSRLLARHLGGDFRSLFQASIGVQPERMGRALLGEEQGFPLAAETGARWDRPTGIGAAMLEPMGGRYWSPDVTPRMMAGFMADLEDFTTLELHREESVLQDGSVASGTGAQGSRSRSLFGPRTADAPGVQPAPVMSWAGSGEVSPTTLAALSGGGLPLTDQLRGSSDGGVRRAPRTSVLLDDLTVDQRTPALTAALMQSSDTVWDRGLSASIAARHESAADLPADSGPVYGLYDAAEATFVGLAEAESEPGPVRRTPSERPSAGPSRVRLQDVAPARRGQRDMGPLRSWQGSISAPGESPGPAPRLATQVTHDRLGRPTVVVDRAGVPGDQIRATPVEPSPVAQSTGLEPSSPIGTTFQGLAGAALDTSEATPTTAAPDAQAVAPVGEEAGLGPASVPARRMRPWASQQISFVSDLEGRRWTGASVADRFRPVAAMPTAPPTPVSPGALDEAIWVSPVAEDDSGAEPRPRAVSTDVDQVRAAAPSVRTSLQRPVVTAREVLSAAPWVAAVARESASASPVRTVLPSLVRWMDQRRDPLTAASDLEVRSDQAHLMSHAPAPLIRELQAAGWTQPEITRVLLALPEDTPSTMEAFSAEVAPRLDRGDGSPVVTGTMARSLARILTGTEALSAPVAAPEISLGSDPYFGAAAPTRAPLLSGLREAIGELLALAHTSIGATGDQPSELREANREQLSRAIGRLSAVAEVPVRSGYAVSSSEQQTWVDLSADVEPASLATRLTAALAASGRGPAGVERLVAELTGPEGGLRSLGDISSASTPTATDVSLAATLAPDAMLKGLASPPSQRRSRRPSRPAADGLPGTLIGLSQGERLPSGGRHHGLADFSGSWLRRVDGTRVGLDLGMEETQAAFRDTFDGFGSSAPSSPMELAADSPIGDASVVVPGGAPEVGATSGTTGPRRRGRARSTSTGQPSRVGAPAQSSDWNWVNTASRSRADTDTLAGGLSAARPTVGGESMPLIAPAMHAVAHSAMRSANTEEAPGRQAAPEPAAAPAAGGAGEVQPEAELSREAFEELAQRMADRISRRLRREKERRGQWT